MADERGLDFTHVLTIDDLVKSDDVFFAASGVTTGDLLTGVEYVAGGARSHSLVMRSRSGTPSPSRISSPRRSTSACFTSGSVRRR